MLTREGWAGLAVGAASLFFFALTFGLKHNPLVPVGPGFYPRILLGLTALAALWLVAADLVRARRPRASRDEGAAAAPRANYGAVIAQFALFAAYAGLMPFLGFRTATFAYVAAANALMDPPRGARGWGRVAALAFATSAGAYVVFERLLLVLLPRGAWTGF